MSKKVFIINGYSQSGKDTFVNYVKKYNKYFVVNLSSVSIVKYYAKQMGWNGVKDEKSRLFLSRLKKILTDYNDLPFKYTIQQVDNDTINKIFFIHCREPKEIKKFVAYFNEHNIYVKTVFVDRQIEQKLSNSSDKNVENYQYDITINNNGDLALLKEKAKTFNEVYINEQTTKTLD